MDIHGLRLLITIKVHLRKLRSDNYLAQVG